MIRYICVFDGSWSRSRQTVRPPVRSQRSPRLAPGQEAFMNGAGRHKRKYLSFAARLEKVEPLCTIDPATSRDRKARKGDGAGQKAWAGMAALSLKAIHLVRLYTRAIILCPSWSDPFSWFLKHAHKFFFLATFHCLFLLVTFPTLNFLPALYPSP